MSHIENAQRVNEFYEALSNDFSRISSLVAEDIEWVNPLPSIIPFGGTYRGVEGLLDYVRKIGNELEMGQLHFPEIIGDGNVVSAIGIEENTLVKSTGKRYTMPCVHVLRFNDEGKVIHVREYNDITEMLAAFEG